MRISMRLGVMLMILLGLAGLVPVPLSVVSAHTEEVELQRRVDEIRREMDEKVVKELAKVSEELMWRDKSITWRDKSVDRWLTVIAVVQAFFALVIAAIAVFGFYEFRRLRTQAENQVDKVRTSAKEAREYLENIQATSSEVAARSDSILRADKTIDSLSRDIMDYLSDDSGIANTDQPDPRGEANYWDQVRRITPDDAEGYLRRGLAKVNLEEYGSAIVDYDEAIRRQHDFWQAYYSRGFARMMLRQHLLALSDFNRTIELKPDYAEAYNARGMVRNVLGQPEAAIGDFDKAIELDPDHARAYTTRGVAKASLNRLQEAKADYEKALELAEEQGLDDIKRLAGGLLYEIDSGTEL